MTLASDRVETANIHPTLSIEGMSARRMGGAIWTALGATLLCALIALVVFGLSAPGATAQERRPSTCLAVANNLQQNGVRVVPAAFLTGNPAMSGVRKRPMKSDAIRVQSMDDTVNIRYAVHATYRIQTADGTIIATDYAGDAGSGRAPDVVTMNHAHGTHWTPNPDPAITHVLRGWGDATTPADHYLEVGDTLIRNVTTDIYRGGMLVEANGNSIFIFETGGLCIGHVGHLHHTLTPEHIAAIGRLDVVMVPVDGGVTLSIPGVTQLVQQFRSSIILPMHWFSGFSLRRFIDSISASFPVEVRNESAIDVSMRNLPASPTVIVLQPERGGFGYGFGPD